MMEVDLFWNDVSANFALQGIQRPARGDHCEYSEPELEIPLQRLGLDSSVGSDARARTPIEPHA
jgi:hypothetical protein